MGPVLGRGGMGHVHHAWDRRLERAVAVKVLQPDLAADGDIRRRFEAEARSAARLVHPNVVAIFDTGEDEGLPYIVMERLPGSTLKDLLAEGPMSPSEVRQVGEQVLAALDAAHRAGVVHRDIKPSNVLSAGDGQWKVGDFGIAKSVAVDEGDHTRTGLVIGTPAYLAPERLYGQPATPAADLFSVGVVLYEALVGRRPFEGPAGTAAGDPPAGSTLSGRPGVEPALASTIDRAIATDPGARFQSAREMSGALVGYGAPLAPSAEPTRLASVVAPGHTDTEVFVAPALLAGWRRRWPLRSRRAVAAGVAIVAVAFLVALAVPGHGSTTRTPPTTIARVVAPTTLVTTPPTTRPGPPPHGKHGGPAGNGAGDGGDGGGG